MLNAILVQIGLIKVGIIPPHLVCFLTNTLPSPPLFPSPPLSPPQSEDKRFVPVSNVSGPLLALTHVIRQDYFPRGMEDILIHFLQKLAHEKVSLDWHWLC